MTNYNNEDNDNNKPTMTMLWLRGWCCDPQQQQGQITTTRKTRSTRTKRKRTVKYLRGSLESRLNKRTKLWPRTRWVIRALRQKLSHNSNDDSIPWTISIYDHIRDLGESSTCK